MVRWKAGKPPEESTNVRRSLAPRCGPHDQASRHGAGACRDHRRRAHHLRAGHVRRHGLRRGDRPSRGRHLPPLPHGPARPLRRPRGQGLGPGVGAGCVLRLGVRPHLRRLSLRRRGVVPRRSPSRRDGAAALRHLGGDLAHLLPTGQGRAARTVGQGRPHGTGRAVHPARPVLHRRRRVARRLRPRPVGVPRPVVRHRHGAVRQRVEGGRRAAAGRRTDVAVRAEADAGTDVARRALAAGAKARVDSRWRTWREARAQRDAVGCARRGAPSRRPAVGPVAGAGPACRRAGRVVSGVPVARPGPRRRSGRRPACVARLQSTRAPLALDSTTRDRSKYRSRGCRPSPARRRWVPTRSPNPPVRCRCRRLGGLLMYRGLGTAMQKLPEASWPRPPRVVVACSRLARQHGRRAMYAASSPSRSSAPG